mmetsp:Transcript_4845/g.7417  ORF Transcript_4845/g.7417 Transcript_4845/m.7417 type:complete len:103 (+) Transcript_4845:119-427(+)
MLQKLALVRGVAADDLVVARATASCPRCFPPPLLAALLASPLAFSLASPLVAPLRCVLFSPTAARRVLMQVASDCRVSSNFGFSTAEWRGTSRKKINDIIIV